MTSTQAHENLKARLGEAYLTLPAEEKQRLRAREQDRLREWAENQASTTPPTSGEAGRDVDQVLAAHGLQNTAEPVRQLMISAWRYGYTTGMADSAKIDEKLAAERVERAQCVPECTWLETRQHADGCQQ